MIQDQAAVAESERTKRMFIQSVGALFGVEQSYANSDAMVVNTPNRYQVYGGAGYAVEGKPASEAQAQDSLPGLLVLAAVALIVWKVVG